MFYSKSTNGFYDPVVNINIPDDAVELSDQTYKELMEGQSQGMLITSDDLGNPILVERPGPTNEQMKAVCASTAKLKLSDTDWSQANDVVPLLANVDEFKSYRAIIRDLALNPVPNPSWPEVPVAIWR